MESPNQIHYNYEFLNFILALLTVLAIYTTPELIDFFNRINITSPDHDESGLVKSYNLALTTLDLEYVQPFCQPDLIVKNEEAKEVCEKNKGNLISATYLAQVPPEYAQLLNPHLFESNITLTNQANCGNMLSDWIEQDQNNPYLAPAKLLITQVINKEDLGYPILEPGLINVEVPGQLQTIGVLLLSCHD